MKSVRWPRRSSTPTPRLLRGAVNEARTRAGVKAVFLNIAHRSQIVVHRQLEILDKAEERQEDPVLLDTLFKLDHLATRERRNAENLIVLGGGQPGRQWRNPVPLIDVVRSAVGETLDYARVRIARLPETQVLGAAVADLTHLLAELMDNATSFSPPQSRVEVTGTVVGKGVVVEISDQGMGMRSPEIGRITIDHELVLYLFGTPGQDRFWFLWDELARGALGAVVLADTRRLDNSFAAIDYFERHALPFNIAVNCFDNTPTYTTDEVRHALDLHPHTPVLLCDARNRTSTKQVLLNLLQHLIEQTGQPGVAT